MVAWSSYAALYASGPFAWGVIQVKRKAKRNYRTSKSLRQASARKHKPKRKGRAGRKGHEIRRVRKLHVRRPVTERQYFSMSLKDQETWDSVVHAITRIREGVSRRKASKEFGIAPNIVAELGHPALRKRNGRYVATKTDRLLRVLTISGVKGKEVIGTRDSRQASLVGAYWAAVQKYIQTGDDSALLKFKGKRVIDASGKRHLLLTDLEELTKQASAGILSFESVYAGGL